MTVNRFTSHCVKRVPWEYHLRIVLTRRTLLSNHSCLSILAASIFFTTPAFSDSPPTLTLDQAVQMAEQSNPLISAALESVKQSEAAVAVAEAGKHFQLTFSSSDAYSNAKLNQPPPIGENFGTSQQSLTVPLPLGPKTTLLIAESLYQRDSARSQFASTQLSIRRSVGLAFFDLLLKESLAAAATDSLNSATREQAETESRNNAGDVPMLDVLQAKVRAATARTELLQAQQSVTTAQETFNDLVGLPVDTPTIAFDDMTILNTPSISLEQARTLAQQNSPDIETAESTVRADEDALGAAKRYRDPQVSLQAFDLRTDDSTSFSRQDSVLASVTIPIDDGGVGDKEITSAQSALNQAADQLKTVKKSVTLAASVAYIAAESSVAEVKSSQQAQDLAQTTYDKTLLGYQNGLYPLTEVLTAESALNQTRQDTVQAEYAAESAQYSLNADTATASLKTGDAAH